jgi:hypothetical protein
VQPTRHRASTRRRIGYAIADSTTVVSLADLAVRLSSGAERFPCGFQKATQNGPRALNVADMARSLDATSGIGRRTPTMCPLATVQQDIRSTAQ